MPYAESALSEFVLVLVNLTDRNAEYDATAPSWLPQCLFLLDAQLHRADQALYAAKRIGRNRVLPAD